MIGSTSFDPNVVRSERNRDRNPAPGVAHDNIAVNGEQDGGVKTYGTQSEMLLVNPRDYLGYSSTAALIFNKMVGTGIFVVPATVLTVTNSKGLSLVLWLVGGLITWAGLVIYLEYGIRFPLSGGELHYIDIIWGRRPRLLATYAYSYMFILIGGSQANALVFGQAVLQASTGKRPPVDIRLQKLFGVLLISVVCLLQAFSRINYVRFSNIFAAYKICFMTIMTVIGFCALADQRTRAAATVGDEYGIANLRDSFQGSTSQPYAVAVALLAITRAYNGYENANFVLEEVRRPPEDENKVFRRAAKATIILVCFFYLMVNVSLFAVLTKDELISMSSDTSTDVLAEFFAKVFGPSTRTRVAAGTLLAMSAAGNVMSVTFGSVRVKQEIARMGVLPFPAFWAKSTRLDTPGPALLLHWFFSSLIVIVTPLGQPNGYLIFSTLFSYSRTIISVILGLGILSAWRASSSFAYNDVPWRPASSRNRIGQMLVIPLAVISIVANLFVFALCWAPSHLQDSLHTKSRILPSYVGPLVSVCTFAVGAVFWLWDLKIAPFFGYRTEVLQELQADLVVHMSFNHHVSGTADRIFKFWFKLSGIPYEDDGDNESTVNVDEDVVHSQRKNN